MTTIMTGELPDTIDSTHSESGIYTAADILIMYYRLQNSN